MSDCLALRRRDIFVENLANSPLSAAIFALILRRLSSIQFAQTYSEAPKGVSIKDKSVTSAAR